MPIAREHRWLYPIDWRELSALIRFGRAGGRCEHCRRPHGRDILHLAGELWWDDSVRCWRDSQGRRVRRAASPADMVRAQPGLAGIAPPPLFRSTHVVLATAHLNHDPGDNRPRNLAALCQHCHMRHDAREHRRRRWLNAFRRRAIGDLFVSA
ncbi:hypothetical protein [uncultured Sphingomonas sp.]|uniref:hypothetical protein n=1 Tax=uncultured Sphingomonas sp. TaxID=158754 RepID=UPI003749FBAA